MYKTIDIDSIFTDWNLHGKFRLLPPTLAWYPCGSLEMASSLSLEQSLPKLEPEALGLKPGTLGGVTFLAPWLKRWLRFMPPTENRKKSFNENLKKGKLFTFIPSKIQYGPDNWQGRIASNSISHPLTVTICYRSS